MSALVRRRAAASRHLAQAFTLVEVLVALAVVAVALSAGLRAAGSVTDNAARLADVSAAQWCADNQLGELRLGKRFPGTGDSEFACEQVGRRYRGELRVRPTPNPNFRRVDAVVSHEDGRPLITVSTIVGRN
jgi:general secretion pathway protein I